ncbi:MAG: hypothetical protein ACLFVS_06640 [Candidatus Acetothermia bacterium]
MRRLVSKTVLDENPQQIPTEAPVVGLARFRVVPCLALHRGDPPVTTGPKVVPAVMCPLSRIAPVAQTKSLNSAMARVLDNWWFFTISSFMKYPLMG